MAAEGAEVALYASPVNVCQVGWLASQHAKQGWALLLGNYEGQAGQCPRHTTDITNIRYRSLRLFQGPCSMETGRKIPGQRFVTVEGVPGP